jgi:hypothetical protein
MHLLLNICGSKLAEENLSIANDFEGVAARDNFFHKTVL